MIKHGKTPNMLDATVLVAYLEVRYPELRRRAEGHSSALQAACWWVAHRTAEEMIDVNTMKDWASILRAGLKPINTMDQVQNYLHGCWDVDNYDSAKQAWAGRKVVCKELIKDLQEFFELNKDKEDDGDKKSSKQRTQAASKVGKADPHR